LALLCIYLTLSQSLCTLVDLASHRRKHKRSKHKSKQSGNKWIRLVLGIVAGVTGKDTVSGLDFTKCIPDKWKGNADTESAAAGNDAAGNASTINTVLDYVGKGIGIACKFKDVLKGMLGRKLFLYNKKLFLAKMSRYYKKRKWSIGGALKSAGNAVKGVATKAVSAVKDVAGKVADAAKSAFNAISGGISGFISKIKDFFVKLKENIQKFIGGDFIATVKKFVECAQSAIAEAKEIIAVVKGIYGKITTIMSGGFIGLGKVLIDLICNFDIFRKAVNNLIDGLKEKDPPRKFEKIGMFVGGILRGIGSKRFMKLQYFLMKTY